MEEIKGNVPDKQEEPPVQIEEEEEEIEEPLPIPERGRSFFSSHRAELAEKLRTAKTHFIEVLMSDDLSQLTDEVIHSVKDETINRFFPLVTACIQKLGSERDYNAIYQKTLDAFLTRISANRCLKTKLLLFCGTEEYSRYWNLQLCYKADCYDRAVQVLEEKKKKVGKDLRPKTLQVTESKHSLSFEKVSRSSSNVSLNKLDDLETEDSLALLAKRMFDQAVTGCVLIKDRKQGAKLLKNTFLGKEAVDWLMANLEILTRSEAVVIGERMLRYGIICPRGGSKKKPFLDGTHFYGYTALMANHESVARATSTRAGLSVEGGLTLKGGCSKTPSGVGSLECRIPVDAIDLQSRYFLSRGVNDVKLVEKAELGFVQIVHPLRIDWENEQALISLTKVEKIFTSLAQPAMVSLHHLPEAAAVGDDAFVEIPPRIIVKKGDNLYQDLSCEVIFRCLNVIWSSSPSLFEENDHPFIYTYEVFPTGDQEGFMEVVHNVQPFKVFDWKKWQAEISDDTDIQNMINSAAGAYVGGYIVGVRDRHWDNILIKDGKTLFQIDFGFLLGTQPPIDAPRFSISQQMKDVLTAMNKWDPFVEKCQKAFLALRHRANEVVRACMRIFGQAGWDPSKVKAYMVSKDSLMLDTNDNGAAASIKKSIENSPSSWQNLFKQFSHKKIDPLWYSLLKSHFPPAEYVMKRVEEKDAKKQAKQKASAPSPTGSIHKVEA